MYKKYTLFLNSFVILALCCCMNLSAQKINLPEQGDNPRARIEEFQKKRMYPFDKIPDGALEKGYQQKKEIQHNSSILHDRKIRSTSNRHWPLSRNKWPG